MPEENYSHPDPYLQSGEELVREGDRFHIQEK